MARVYLNLSSWLSISHATTIDNNIGNQRVMLCWRGLSSDVVYRLFIYLFIYWSLLVQLSVLSLKRLTQNLFYFLNERTWTWRDCEGARFVSASDHFHAGKMYIIKSPKSVRELQKQPTRPFDMKNPAQMFLCIRRLLIVPNCLYCCTCTSKDFFVPKESGGLQGRIQDCF